MFSKNDPRPAYNTKVLKESYEKENRQMRIHDEFVPNPRRSTLAGKFYSVHESVDLTTANDKILEILKDYKDRTPAQRYPQPVLESQVIGWSKPLIPIKKDDRRFYCPKQRSISLTIVPIKTGAKKAK